MKQYHNLSMFLDWTNNFITIDKYSAYYGISTRKAKKAIALGKIAHESQFGPILEYAGYHNNLESHMIKPVKRD